jgi:hypothetical protein
VEFGLDKKSFDQALKELGEIAKGVTPEQLEQWTKTIEATAKKLCDDSENKIVFQHAEGKEMKFSIKDKESRDYLVKAIETHLDTMPEMLRGYFSVVKYRLMSLEFSR